MGRTSSRGVFNGTLVILLSFCILLGAFGWKNASAEGYTCGLEEHTHDDACYEKTLIYDNEDSEHEHTDEYYEKTLICDKTEHTHTVECLSAAETEETAEQQEETTEENAAMALALDDDSGISAQADTGVPDTIDGKTPPNTVINLFDYWTTDEDNPSSEKTKWVFAGINQRDKEHKVNPDTYNASTDRPLIFWVNSSSGYGLANSWTGNNGGDAYSPRQGIVQNQLGTDGYPLINWEKRDYWPSGFYNSTNGNTLREENASLAYLFDSSEYSTVLGKRVYSNVNGLFQVDEQGYYYYDCTQNYAWYNERDNVFELYDGVPKTLDQFYPFAPFELTNSITDEKDPRLNHYFGMTMTTRFIQDYDGKISAGSNASQMTFDFSGDDDVWIFVDDVLVSDVGGIHRKVGTTINFATGEVIYYDPRTYNPDKLNTEDEVGVIDRTTLEKQFNAVYSAKNVDLVETRAKDENGWKITTEGNYIFSNNTSHTLKFFYMERGNSESNLKLTTNLLQIPETSVTKVDQYENPMGDVPLAIYTASPLSEDDETDSSKYYFLDDTGQYKISPSSITSSMIDTNGKITTTVNDNGEEKKVYITPKVKGTTNSVTYDEDKNVVSGSGEWILRDDNGVPYTTQDLKDKIGSSQMILREIQVPNGYRTVSDNIFLYFDQGEHLTTPNPYESGVWPSPNVLVTASNTLYSATKGDAIQYRTYNSADNTWDTEGTLFAVVMKRNGASLDPDKPIIFETDWTPVYGNDTQGYKTTKTKGLKAVLEAYLQNIENQYSDPTFTETTAGSQVYLTDMPGSLERYYTYMLEHNDKGIEYNAGQTEPQYCVCYFYADVDESVLKSLTLDQLNNMSDVDFQNWVSRNNFTRVVSHKGFLKSEDSALNENYEGFYLKWSSIIKMTNIEDRLYFQKTDELGIFVNGATFALYNANEDESGKVYLVADDQAGTAVYLGDDSDGDNEGIATVNEVPYTYSIDGEGTITISDSSGKTDYTISPAKNADGETLKDITTSESTNQIEEGTGKFEKLLDGRYVLREIAAPDGYLLNTELVKVLVNEDGVYANAGTEDDGVIVGNGAGFLIPTFNNCASLNDIDETLTWIYTLLRLNTKNNRFNAYDTLNVLYAPKDNQLAEDDPWSYALAAAKTGGMSSDTTKTRSSAMVTYLQYNGNQAVTSNHMLFDYITNDDQRKRSLFVPDGTDSINYSTAEGQNSLRLYTDEGWSELSIMQDYAYGSIQSTTGNTTTYTNLTTQNAYGASNVNLNLANLFSNSTFVRVSNPRPVDVTLNKVDATAKTSLSGAEFIIYQTSQDGTGKVYYQYKDGVTSWVESQDDATAVSFYDQDRTLHGLASRGTYYLQETKAPSGYIIETQPWTLTLKQTKLDESVTENQSNAKIKTTVSLTNPGGTVALSATVYTLANGTYSQTATDALNLVNTKIYNLPNSGSFGVLPFILAGSLILGFSVYLLIREERKTEA